MFFILPCYLLRRVKMPPYKFEANPALRLRVKCSSFSLFPLASSCSNAYFHAYAIIDFLADCLIFLNSIVSLLPTTFSPESETGLLSASRVCSYTITYNI